ncbi:hypothetical protein QYF61_016270 [Mycteria americana]|uniref:Uncharacterized protein n=1 Tax=Mycteria americana TaxID=33587 RepID=A0AAN7RKF4_MYCAM|nr:hypothetical protein QYF61_016270 [Mycteria americana]
MIALPKTASNHHIAHKSISVGEQEVQRGTFPRWLTHQLRQEVVCHTLQEPPGLFPLCWHIHLLQHGVLHRLQGGYVLYLGPPWAVGGHSASPWSSPQAAGESLLRCWSLRIHVAKVSSSGVAVSQWAAESALVVSPWCQSGVQKGPQGGGSCTLEECP